MNPSEKLQEDGLPVSFHVVLDKWSFAYLSYTNDKWTSDEQRPAGLVGAVGKLIKQRY